MERNKKYKIGQLALGRELNKGDTNGQMVRWKIGKFRWRKGLADVYLNDRRQAPGWASDELILAIYRLAKKLRDETGKQWVVDHAIPLRGELVSGLHTHMNLQIILHRDNHTKGNIFK